MRVLVVLVLAGLLLAGCTMAPKVEQAPDLQPRFDAALAYVEGLRDADGRWPTAQVPLAMDVAIAAHLNVTAWPVPIPVAQQVVWPAEEASLLSSLRALDAEAHAAAAANDAARLERVRERVLSRFDGRQFGDPVLLNDDAFSLLVLGHARVTWSSAFEPVVAGLLANQSDDGGWSWKVGGAGETDMTGMVLSGLAEAGAIHRVDAERVLGFLATTSTSGGGHGLLAGGEPNCDSTVWAIRVQERLGRMAPTAPWAYLLGLQNPDGGFSYTPGGPSNALCSFEAATLLGMAVVHEVQIPPSLTP